MNLRKHINKLMIAKLASNNLSNTDLLQHSGLGGTYGLHRKGSKSSSRATCSRRATCLRSLGLTTMRSDAPHSSLPSV